MILDNSTKISNLDTENMFEMVYNWPELIERTLRFSFEVPKKSRVGKYKISYENSISNVVICGMGGSAISGDYLKVYLEDTLEIPLIVQRKYNIPNFVGKNTLVVLISYSGNTEETISCLITSIKKSAQVVGLGSGGRIEDFFRKYKLPFHPVLSGYQPRAAFPLLFFPLLKILNKMNLSPLDNTALEETVSVFKEIRDEFDIKTPFNNNSAKQIAKELHNRIPVIWSPYGCISSRMNCQLNENSKILAISKELPELNHNHIVGWQLWKTKNPFIIIAFRFKAEHPNVSLRFEISKEIVSPKVTIIEIESRGSSFLCQLFSATYFGDYISMYLAILNNQNPSAIDNINSLKKQLEERANTQSELFSILFKLHNK
ncbi:MAG: bifunctional phosphoglucose/phosphomannose isomerase [Candidatus Hodarchaeales archaeon]